MGVRSVYTRLCQDTSKHDTGRIVNVIPRVNCKNVIWQQRVYDDRLSKEPNDDDDDDDYDDDDDCDDDDDNDAWIYIVHFRQK